MKSIAVFIILLLLISCHSEKKQNPKQDVFPNKEIKKKEKIKIQSTIGERINGPANIRSKPNGEVLFELYDNTLVEATALNGDWLQVLVFADIQQDEFEMDSMKNGRVIVSKGDTIGKVLKTFSVSTGQGKDFAYAMLYGYTHKKNIKPETIIENALLKEFSKEKRNLAEWKKFIRNFKLETDAIGYNEFDTYYNYENTIDDPSPGFRIVLLFRQNTLVGFVHSREVKIETLKTHQLDRGYRVSFFTDYPKKDQLKFVDFMNEWTKNVD